MILLSFNFKIDIYLYYVSDTLIHYFIYTFFLIFIIGVLFLHFKILILVLVKKFKIK